MNRDDFRHAVFTRDKNKCVFCDKEAVDAHHIMERRLYSDGGYHLNNGISVCAFHHMECEKTNISVEDARIAAGIIKPNIPDHLYDDEVYDKWGNIILPNGQRTRGELFFDSSVQKVLADKLHLFTYRVKYPRTYHLPWSENVTDDDRIVSSLEHFIGREVVVTRKMDGENTTVYNDYTHARSVDSRHHVSRDWLKNFASRWQHNLPEGWRLCGENLYAVHSIAYRQLLSYLLGFSLWNKENECLSYKDTLEWFELLGITPTDVLYWGMFDEKKIKAIKLDSAQDEGYVIRIADKFSYRHFRNNVAKYVRKDHVKTVKHWMRGQALVKNELLMKGSAND